MSAPSPRDELGYDAYLGGDADDITSNGRSATGLELVDASILHRLVCDTLPCVDAPDGVIPFGVVVFDWLGEASDAAALDAKVPLVDAALQLDPRIASTRIAIEPAPPGLTLAGEDGAVEMLIRIDYTTVTGARISRIVGVSAVSVGFLARAA